MRDMTVHEKADNGLTECGLGPYGRRMALRRGEGNCAYCKVKLQNERKEYYERDAGSDYQEKRPGEAAPRRPGRVGKGRARKDNRAKAVRKSAVVNSNS